MMGFPRKGGPFAPKGWADPPFHPSSPPFCVFLAPKGWTTACQMIIISSMTKSPNSLALKFAQMHLSSSSNSTEKVTGSMSTTPNDDKRRSHRIRTIPKAKLIAGLRHYTPGGTKHQVFSQREARSLLGRTATQRVRLGSRLI